MSIIQKLTEGIVGRDLQKEGSALLEKWERTGLLEGLEGDSSRNGMARLLENQAKQLLREVAGSAMAQGDVEGFASVAFPLVRRVFGGLLANDLVSVQPMSLPSGLIFFLDFTYGDTRRSGGGVAGDSLFGGGIVGRQITGGVTLDDTASGQTYRQEQGFYNLNNAYSSPTGSSVVEVQLVASGTAGRNYLGTSNAVSGGFLSGYEDLGRLTRFDPDVSGSVVAVGRISKTDSGWSQLDVDNLISIHNSGGYTTHGQGGPNIVRRLTMSDPVTSGYYTIVAAATGTEDPWDMAMSLIGFLGGAAPFGIKGKYELEQVAFNHAINDNFVQAQAQGALKGAATWGLEDNVSIPEIDIKVDSIAVTAMTKKLKAKWTPELGQDLNAYHNLDAEVELTSILSEQIALEIDREILEDLVKGATAGTLYWARSPGQFLNRETGIEVGASSASPDFTGTVSEWYETLLETINDVSARIHRKTLRGGANFLVTSPEVASIMEMTSGFRASIAVDDDKGSAGAVKVGNVSKKWDVYIDPYFPRNLILVGRKGGSFLESGYVYAPYVPLQVTPTIFGTEDFVPRKGVMTRYAKKMVRPDMYGLVIVRGLLGEEGAGSA